MDGCHADRGGTDVAELKANLLICFEQELDGWPPRHRFGEVLLVTLGL